MDGVNQEDRWDDNTHKNDRAQEEPEAAGRGESNHTLGLKTKVNNDYKNLTKATFLY